MQKKIIDLLVERYGNKCEMCGDQLTNDNLVVDHIFPLALGGTDDLCNLRLLCRECNFQSANLVTSEYAFGRYMFEIISNNNNFRNTNSGAYINRTKRNMVDITTERKTDDKWEELSIVIKYTTSMLTMNRVKMVIGRFNIISQVQYKFPKLNILYFNHY